jgi:hypothetical protein
MTFSFREWLVRSVLKGAETWFVVADVCAVLGHTDASKAVSRLDDDEKGLLNVRTLGGDQTMNVISESGLYALILTSRKPQAKAFRRWVTGEVLPSIRRAGSYHQEPLVGQPGVASEPKLVVPSVVLPGPGRYIALVLPDGTVHLRASEYDALLDEITATETRVMCHNLKVIEGHWNGTQQQRSLGIDPHNTFACRALESAILNGGALADHHLRFQGVLKR